MKTRCSIHFARPPHRPRQGVVARAFSLIEIMVTVGLLSVIILGLLAMFNQTQRAFRSSITQTDVLEPGRATTDMLAREIEQMAPSYSPFTTNFFSDASVLFANPLYQTLPGSGEPRVNFVQRFFFLSRVNTSWIGTGYQVIPEYPNAGVGSLYRFSSTVGLMGNPLYLSREFLQAPLTNFSRIMDGVVHLRVRAFDPHGRLMNDSMRKGIYPQNIAVYTNNVIQDQVACYCISNAVPAYVEVELGVLEPPMLQRYKSIATPQAQLQYLSNHVAQVHVFRQRVPIRSVDYSVYQ